MPQQSDFKFVKTIADKLKNKILIHITDLPLCSVIMEITNDFPWIFLVPRINDIAQINQLSEEDQSTLYREVDFCSNIMEKLFETDRLNVGAIGNLTPQLHFHIICRHKNDPLWPDVCWNKDMTLMNSIQIEERKSLIANSLNKG
ncbi:MAG: HIT domain-containing protein [Alphaproteobacteria bacterium]|nr:HIT domain-containing protein [Alphaproteobacteria bacterium]MBL0717781.1 HIT domain-containing protein [Alphaproteobacteria bacterium]